MFLNQVNALVTGRKSETEKAVTSLYQVLEKDALFDGLDRVYRPLTEDGEKLPNERKLMQKKVNEILASAEEKWSELWNLVATQDAGNQEARADVKVDEKVILKQVPVSTLLFLEKQTNDMETFFSKLPTPDPAEEWNFDDNLNCLRSKVSTTARTKKVMKNHVKAEATDKHPAQVEIFHEDVLVGYWDRTLYSGKIPAKLKQEYLTRVKKLRDALKLAREEANKTTVTKVDIAKNIFDYVLN